MRLGLVGQSLLLAGLAALLLAADEAPAQRMKRLRERPEALAGAELRYLKEVEQGMYRLTNELRRRHGLPVLTRDQSLNRVARAHSEDMVRRQYVNHVSPEGRTPQERLASGCPYALTLTGENIWGAQGTHPLETTRLARIIVDTWMSSSGHREAMLQQEFTDTGVGVVAAGQTVRATQVFAAIRQPGTPVR
jgi:uncharacterized protein YkwD